MIKYNVCSTNCNKNNKIVLALHSKSSQSIFFNNVCKKKDIAQSICQLQFKNETPIHCFRNQRILDGVVCNIQTSSLKSQCFLPNLI